MTEAEKVLADGLMGDVLRRLGREVPQNSPELERAFQAAVQQKSAPVDISLEYLTESANIPS